MTKLPQAEREEKLELRRRALAASDGVFVSTDALARAARSAQPTRRSRPERRLGRDGRGRRRRVGRAGAPEQGAVTIGYFSGTASHDVDFLEAAAGVLEALTPFPPRDCSSSGR